MKNSGLFMRIFEPPMGIMMVVALMVLNPYGCGAKDNRSAGGPGDAAPISTSGDSPDGSQTSVSPYAADLATNPQTQSLCVGEAIDSAIGAVASGISGAGSIGSYTFVGENRENFTSSSQANQSITVTNGNLSQDCYLGSTIAARTTSSAPAWPESADAISVFANSKNDPTTPARMYIEPALLQYPATHPTATLSLSTPFAIASMAEVMQKDSRQFQWNIGDTAQTSITGTNDIAEHRFWVAKNPTANSTDATMACTPSQGVNAKGSSGTASGKWAMVTWQNAARVDGLNLLTRLSATLTRAKSYLPKSNGVLATTPSILQYKTQINGERLTAWTSAATNTASIAGATVVLQKTVTHALSRIDQQLNGSNQVKSTITGTDEVRASAPFVIQEYRDANEDSLAHVISSGTIYRTATGSTGTVIWFASFAFANIKFDYINSSEICIPVSGTLTLTVFDKEGGTRQGQLIITYASTASVSAGKVDPTIAVSGDDAASTHAQWMMLNADRMCEFKL